MNLAMSSIYFLFYWAYGLGVSWYIFELHLHNRWIIDQDIAKHTYSTKRIQTNDHFTLDVYKNFYFDLLAMFIFILENILKRLYTDDTIIANRLNCVLLVER